MPHARQSGALLPVKLSLTPRNQKRWRNREASAFGGEKPGGNHKGRDAALYSVSDLLAEHGVTFDGNRALWLAYERAVRIAALASH